MGVELSPQHWLSLLEVMIIVVPAITVFVVGITVSIVVQWLEQLTLDQEVSGTILISSSVALCLWARHFTCMWILSTQDGMGTWLDSKALYD